MNKKLYIVTRSGYIRSGEFRGVIAAADSEEEAVELFRARACGFGGDDGMSCTCIARESIYFDSRIVFCSVKE